MTGRVLKKSCNTSFVLALNMLLIAAVTSVQCVYRRVIAFCFHIGNAVIGLSGAADISCAQMP